MTRALPTPAQIAWHDMEVGMFVHLAPNTWQDQEYDDRSTRLTEINPSELDTDQWASVALAMGAKYLVFTAKHVGGFCMWQTGTSAYGLKETPWREGRGDVLADLSRSCRERGLKLGVYLSPRDDHHGAGLGGLCATPEEQQRYTEVYRRQLTEVLSRYGEIAEVWFDGGMVIEVGDILRQWAPHSMVFQGPHATIRWVGNEDGIAPYPAWNAVSVEAWQRGATAADGDPDGAVWLPNECDARMRRDWFWSSSNAETLKSVAELMAMYYASVGHGAVLLLNHTPDTTGRIPAADAERAAEFGAEVRKRFGQSIAEACGSGHVLTVTLPRATVVDHVVTMEDIAYGERVRSYAIEGLAGSSWLPLCAGTAIGHKKIDRFEPVGVSKVRLRVVASVGTPQIRRMALFHVGAE